MRQTPVITGMILGSTVALVSAYPVWAAATQVTAVRLNPKESELELILETQAATQGGDERPQFFTTNQGNALVADITNAQLSLSEGDSFRKDNPMPGIASVAVSSLDGNSIRVTVSGAESVPKNLVFRQGPQGMSLGITPAPPANTQAATSTPTAVATAAAPLPAPSAPVPTAATPTPLAQAPLQAPETIQPPPPELVPAPVPQPIAPSSRPDVLVPNPTIIQGTPAAPAGAVQPIAPAPPFLPRAVAPPVGDISVSTIDPAPTVVDLGTAARIPRLVLREAPVREVLALLARSAGLNLAFTQGATEPGQPGAQPAQPGQIGEAAGPTISIDIEDEPIQDVFNYILQLSGLEANRRGRTIFAGPRLPDVARNVVSRTIRLNQVPAGDAATFLATQGAETQLIFQQNEQVINPETGEIIREIIRPPTLISVAPTRGPNATSPLVLRGLAVSTDTRLNAITLVGNPRIVEIASGFLTQLDARRRQVAVNVKIIDVNLTNSNRLGTSFSFGIGDTDIVNQGGIGIVNFGPGQDLSPAFSDITDADVGASPRQGFSGFPFNVVNAFAAQLQASIQTGNAKILTDPTLIVQEGSTANVQLTQDVVTNITTDRDIQNNTTEITVTPETQSAGLILTIAVAQIDDNGFITMTVNPVVTAVGNTQVIDTAVGRNTIALLSTRSLSTGTVRLRDGQTLILSGIIQEQDRVLARKVPILGDLPIIGALFRSSESRTERAEVIVLVTPRILDDSAGSAFGYNYTPGPQTRQFLEQRGVSP